MNTENHLIYFRLWYSLEIRKNLIKLLNLIYEHGYQTIQPTNDGLLILSNGDYLTSLRHKDFCYLGEQSAMTHKAMPVSQFIQKRRDTIRRSFENHQDIINDIEKTYTQLLSVMEHVENPYSPFEELYLVDRERIVRSSTLNSHFVTHVDSISEYLPLIEVRDNKPVPVRELVNTLYLLKCCFDDTIDYEVNTLVKKLQEEYSWYEYNLNA